MVVLILRSARGVYYLHTQECSPYGNKKCFKQPDPAPSIVVTAFATLGGVIFLILFRIWGFRMEKTQ